MASAPAILGLLLDGGFGRRMGGRDKGLVCLAGQPMLAHVANRLRPQCAALAISANGDPERFSDFAIPVVPDILPQGVGPLAGVLGGLEFAAGMSPAIAHVVTATADAPFLPVDFVARLAAACRAEGATLAVAASAGRRHHAAALWPLTLATDLRRALLEEGLRKVESFQARYPVAVVEWTGVDVDPFFNVNFPQDLAFAEATLKAVSGIR